MRDSTSAGEEVTVTVFDLLQYFYCPRKVYFLRVMGVPVKIKRKMKYGQKIQQREERRMKERKRIYGLEREEIERVMQKVQIEDSKIGLSGQVDTVLKLDSGEFIPVDTKYTDHMKIYRSFKKQIVAYALLLDHHFNVNTGRGIIFFAKQKKSLEVNITDGDKKHILRDIKRIQSLIKSEKIPRKATSEKCGYCEVKKYCV